MGMGIPIPMHTFIVYVAFFCIGIAIIILLQLEKEYALYLSADYNVTDWDICRKATS